MTISEIIQEEFYFFIVCHYIVFYLCLLIGFYLFSLCFDPDFAFSCNPHHLAAFPNFYLSPSADDHPYFPASRDNPLAYDYDASSPLHYYLYCHFFAFFCQIALLSFDTFAHLSHSEIHLFSVSQIYAPVLFVPLCSDPLS